MATTFTAVQGRRIEPHKTVGLRKEIFGLLVTDGTDGANAGEILASIFGLTYIESCSPAVISTNATVEILAPNYSATRKSTSLVAKNAASGAALDLPVGTYAITVTGY